MRKYWWCALLVVSSCIQPDDQLATSTAEISNGSVDAGDPHVVAVRLFPGGGTESGVLIGQRTVLTVAHGFKMSPNTTTVRVYFGQDAFYYDRMVDVQSWQIHPSYDATGAGENDLALLYLASPVTDVPLARLNRRPPTNFTGTTLRLVGYGYDGNGGGLGTKRTGTATIYGFGGATDPELIYTAGPSLNDSGDSGGPAFLSTDGIEVVAGIMRSAGNTFGYATDVYGHISDFIQPWAINRDQTVIDYDCSNIVANEGTCAGNVLTWCDINTGLPDSIDCGASYPDPQGCGIVNTSWRGLPVSGCTCTTCEALGKNCGQVYDGCGTLDCGTCTGGETCGGSGVANVCGSAGGTATCCNDLHCWACDDM